MRRPKGWGGLGLLNLRNFGTALRCSWKWLGWNPGNRPWHLLPDQQDKDYEVMFDAANLVVLGNGTVARFWTDNWATGGRSISALAPALFSYVRLQSLS